MLNQFKINILKNNLFNKTDKLLLAFSGGVDSVVLANLLKQTDYQFELAHCNFQLRGDEANGDTAFCEAFAKQLNVPIHIIYFDTKEYAQEHKLSIQMAARELRYHWFDNLRDNYDFNYVLTAHHANDTVETLLVNLIRGTGIKGLRGIPEKENKRVRPLLFATKNDVLNYALKNKITYRDDSSNQETKYKRNFIRHEIVPELKKLNPTLEQTIISSTQFFKQSYDIVKAFSEQKFKELCNEKNDELTINIKALLDEPQKETLLYEWLNTKGFNTKQIQQLCDLLLQQGNIGKLFNSSTHRLVIDRTYIYVKKIKLNDDKQAYRIENSNDTKHLPIALKIEKTSTVTFSENKNTICIPNNNALFPLILRQWKQGDYFKPFGMKGNKKLSDFFKDQKLNQFEKENVWLLCNNEHIIWVVGYRLDERYRITESDKAYFKITVST